MSSPTMDLAGTIEDMSKRLFKLEQRITSPEYVVPNGSSPTFSNVKIGTPGGSLDAILGVNPEPPTGLTLTTQAQFNEVSITATWTASTDKKVVEYEVDWFIKAVNADTYTPVNFARTTGTSLTFRSLIPGRTYGVRVRSVSSIGGYSAPAPANGYVTIVAATDTTIPAALTNVKVTPGLSSITVTWDDSTEPDVRAVGNYQIQVDDVDTFTEPLLFDNRTTASIVSVGGLTQGATVHTRVRAIDSSGNAGPWTTVAGVVVGSETGATGGATSDGTPPASSPAASARSATGFIFASWPRPANADPLTFEVHIGTLSTFVPDATTKVQETDATYAVIKNAPDGTALPYDSDRFVRIIAKDADGAAAAGTVSAAARVLKAGTADIASGAITAESGIIASLDAGKITVGTMSGDRIAANTIVSGHITTTGLDAAVIKFGTMHGDRIQTNTLNANAIVTSSLSSTTITLATNGIIRSSGTNYFTLSDAGLRFFAGTNLVMSLDTANGAASFKGDITGASGTFNGTVFAENLVGSVITGKTYRTADTAVRVQINSGSNNQVLFHTGGHSPGIVSTTTAANGNWLSISPPVPTSTDRIGAIQLRSGASESVCDVQSDVLSCLRLFASTGGINTTGTITQNGTAVALSGNHHAQFISTSSSGQILRVGDDVWLADTNMANRFAVQGVQNSAIGEIQFGNAVTVTNNGGSFGSIAMNGGRNGWPGIHFLLGQNTLMMDSGTTGVYNEGSSSWRWYFSGNANGTAGEWTLNAGQVPWGRVSSKPFGAISRGNSSVTPDVNGYFNMTHGLGGTPTSAVLTGRTPNTGAAIPASLIVYSWDATHIYVRALNQTGGVITTAISFSYICMN